jgi:hypothetical protein
MMGWCKKIKRTEKNRLQYACANGALSRKETP